VLFRSGLGSLNHPFGVGVGPRPGTLSPEAVSSILRKNNLHGLEISEFGYRQREGNLDEHLWVYDDLARHGLFIIPTGVSDSHGGDPIAKITGFNNFVTWIYTDQPSLAALDRGDLLAGLKGSRCYFGDPGLFQGTVDLDAGREQRMGKIVLTNKNSADITCTMEGVMVGDTMDIIRDGEVVQTVNAIATDISENTTVELFPDSPTTVRTALYRNTGLEKVFSSHLTFIREIPSRGVTAERIAFDTGDFYSFEASGLHVSQATITETPDGPELMVSYTADAGSITFEPNDNVSLHGQVTQTSGSYQRQANGQSLLLDSLNGEGVLTISLATSCPGDCDMSLTVDFNDLVCILFEFGETSGIGDVDGSGLVDFNDLVATLFQFGPCPE